MQTCGLEGHSPRIRLRNKYGENGGSWISDSMLARAQKDLREYQEEEPQAGWKLEVCGEVGHWHEYTP